MSSEENRSPAPEAGTAEEPEIEPSQTPASEPESGEIVQLMDSMKAVSAIAPGETVRATVVKLTDAEVIVDVGLKCEGAIPRGEFETADGQLTIAPGDTVDVFVEQYNEEEGTVAISYQKAFRRKLWDDMEKAFQEQKTIQGRVLERIKGGLMVDIGIRAFLPASHADLRPHFNLDALVGQGIPCKIIKLNRKRNNAVVSRRLALEEEHQQRKARLLEQLREGAVLEGRVKNLTDYGVFVDLGGMDGLLHITDLSWGRVGHPSDVVQPGQELKVKVLKYDPEKERVSLGLKQLSPDPWEHVPSTYHVGDRVKGRVVGIVDYGVFVELQPGVEGLIHVSELSWSRRLKHPSKLVKLGEWIEAAVLEVDGAQRRISLSLKHTLPDPWMSLAERCSVGTVVEGRVRNLTEFGAFVEIEEGVDGLIHLSNLSWSKDVKHPSEVLKKGQRVEAVILSLDPAKRRLSLGLKQLQPDNWEEFCMRTQVGDIVRGRVSRITSFGAFIEIEEGVEGLCHLSEKDEDHSGSGARQLEVGRELNFRVLRLSPAEKRIGLSLKGVPQEADQREAAETASETSVTAAGQPASPPPTLEAES
jgi:small subunit ribosomal protein S1